MASSKGEKKSNVPKKPQNEGNAKRQSKSESEELKTLQDEINQMKTTMKAQLQEVALRKFSQKIIQFRNLRVELTGKIEAAKKNIPPCTIPVPDSLLANQKKLNDLSPDTVASVMALNPNLRCFELINRPVLLKNCQMPPNQVISGLIEKILPHLLELDDDLDKLEYALRLLLPRMREGEYLGTEMLLEACDFISLKQNTLQSKSYLYVVLFLMTDKLLFYQCTLVI